MEHASPERPVDPEPPTWTPVNIQQPEENIDTAFTGFLTEAPPHLPTASTDTALPDYATGQGSNGGMFNLIIRINERTSVIGRCQPQP